jgi:hypothetical protein
MVDALLAAPGNGLEGEIEKHVSEVSATFETHFPRGELSETAAEDIPERAMTYFEAKSRDTHRTDEYIEGNFERFLVITHDNGDRTYVATQTVTYPTNGDTERLAYLMDFNEAGSPVGGGEIRHNTSNQDNYFRDKPFVGFTITDQAYQRRGFGKRRLNMMNALSRSLHGNPIHSDTNMAPNAENLWKNLVEEGAARAYKEGQHNRYMFL